VNEIEYKELLLKLQMRQFALVQEISDAEMRKADLENEMANLKATIAKLQPLCGETPDPDDLSGLGFSEAVKKAIYLSGTSRLSPNEVKEVLEKRGFSLSGYSNPMASIYTILNRLKERDEIVAEWEGLRVFYKANPKKFRRGRIARLRNARRIKGTVDPASIKPPAS
jgi:hypothetical protein